MSTETKLNRCKKAELQALAVEVALPSGSDGVRNDLIARLSAFIEKKGGLEAMVADGTLSDSNLISMLGLESSPAPPATSAAKTPTKAATADTTRSPVRSPPSRRGTTAANSKSSGGWVSTLKEVYSVHGPQKLVDFVTDHPAGSNLRAAMVDLRQKLATAESLVLVLVYAEVIALVLSQIGRSANPVLTFNVPAWFDNILSSVLHVTSSGPVWVYAPDLSGLLSRKSFLYPLFYWFCYFVGIPSALGWLVNFDVVHSDSKEHICPVSMLTFSLSRLLIFFLMLKTDLHQIYSAAPEFSHRSLTVLFDGHHLPLKLFLTTTIVGLVYAVHGRKKQ